MAESGHRGFAFAGGRTLNSVEECRLALGGIQPIHCTSHVAQFFSEMDEALTYQRFLLPTENPWYFEVCGNEGQEGDGLT